LPAVPAGLATGEMGGADAGLTGVMVGAVLVPVSGVLCPRVTEIRMQSGLGQLPAAGSPTAGRPVPRG
jgi:hypothetical protein